MARKITQKLTLGEPASEMITPAKVGQWSRDIGGGGILYSLPCLNRRSDAASPPDETGGNPGDEKFREVKKAVLAQSPHRGHQTQAPPCLNL